MLDILLYLLPLVLCLVLRQYRNVPFAIRPLMQARLERRETKMKNTQDTHTSNDWQLTTVDDDEDDQWGHSLEFRL